MPPRRVSSCCGHPRVRFSVFFITWHLSDPISDSFFFSPKSNIVTNTPAVSSTFGVVDSELCNLRDNMVRACPQKAYLHVCIPDTWYGMFLLLCFADKVEELAFAATGDFFLTRDPECRTASLWSVKPDVALVQVWCSMQAAVCMYVCIYVRTDSNNSINKISNNLDFWFTWVSNKICSKTARTINQQ